MSATSLKGGFVRVQHGETAGALATFGRAPRYVQRGFRFATTDSDSAMPADVRGDAVAMPPNGHI